MAVDVDDFEIAVENSGVSGEFYGEYNGRGSHEGYAVSLDNVSELFALGVALAAEPTCESIQDHRPHIDSLGVGIIASWPKRLFKTS